MEKNGNGATDTDKMGVCEKIFSAITVNPSFRTIRRIKHFSQDSVSVSPARSRDPSPLPANSHVTARKIIDIQSKPPQPMSAEAPKVIRIPITSEKTALPAAATPNGSPKPKAELLPQSPQNDIVRKGHDHQASAKVAGKIEPAKPTHVLVLQEKHKPEEDLAQEGKEASSKVEEEHNAAMKVVEAQVQVKNEGKKQGVLDINDTFSEYINRAKIKIRTMSSKNISESDDDAKIKESGDNHFSDYIHRAKNKFKSCPSNLGSERNASFERQ